LVKITAHEARMDLEVRRRQLGFRAWHRGTREADILVGRFAESYLPNASADEVATFGALLDENDPDIYDWVTGKTALPADMSPALQALVRCFIDFVKGHGAAALS
jgi:antitoxin CptB